jgi:uncharacterized cupin superfamily protein
MPHERKMTACQKATEAYLESKEPTSVEIESVMLDEVVPKEEAAVKAVRVLKKRSGGWHLAVEHCRQLKKQTQGDGGSWENLAGAHRGMWDVPPCHSCTMQVTRSSGNRQGQCCSGNLESTYVQEETLGATGMQQWHKEPSPKGAITSEKHDSTQQDLQEDHRARDCEANSWNFHYTAKHECQDFVEGSAHFEAKEEAAHRVRAGDVGAQATLGSLAPTDRKSRMMVIHLDWLTPYQGATWDERP